MPVNSCGGSFPFVVSQVGSVEILPGSTDLTPGPDLPCSFLPPQTHLVPGDPPARLRRPPALLLPPWVLAKAQDSRPRSGPRSRLHSAEPNSGCASRSRFQKGCAPSGRHNIRVLQRPHCWLSPSESQASARRGLGSYCARTERDPREAVALKEEHSPDLGPT